MDRIGRYRLERRIGAGSFATVWLGHDDGLDVPVAIKVLAENWLDNDDVRDRFLAEAQLLRRIRDRRIVRVHDLGTLADGRPYFVMDFCDAGSLDDLRREPGDPLRALRLCAEGCRAIEALHRDRIVHRDITPGNLLLDTGPDGRARVVLADLGVAKEMTGGQGRTMTAGTPAYMAPEQAAGETLDVRADVYAMAAVTYAVLSGRPPFAVTNVADVIARDAGSAPEPLAERLGTPAALDDVLRAALSHHPADRPASAELLGHCLDEVAEAMTGGPPAISAPRNPVSRPGLGWQFWALAGASALLVVLGVMFLILAAVR